MSMDATTAALIGAGIGAISGISAAIISAFTTSRRERDSFGRQLRQERIALIRDNYSLALNVLFNMERGGAPDRATRGKVYAQVALTGSMTVRDLVEKYISSPVHERTLSLAAVIDAMQEHIRRIEEAT